ncbi:hypothetical protein [Ferrimonas marina]|uniref:Uncharacterized protein n=1 Tax=Ferrimonas marina TaxID=299255 RepID=A0A1M5U2M3_9GAMM|nr:hypothetical protein [Ferrimonas marina]SHH57219.1 hypothetical protein SAMN02745129_2380 [Ferrimonas marina]
MNDTRSIQAIGRDCGLSVFETPLARWRTDAMRHLVEDHYPWQTTANEHPISDDEIRSALALPTDQLIPPGHYDDNPTNPYVSCNHGCSRDQHIRRIAWFAINYKDSPEHALILSNITDLDGHPDGNDLLNGHHRLIAALYRGDKSIYARFIDGCASLQNLPGYSEWTEQPAVNGLFGTNTISDGEASLEWLEQGPDRLVVNDGQTGGCVLNLRTNHLLQIIDPYGQPLHSELGEKAQLCRAVQLLAERYPTLLPAPIAHALAEDSRTYRPCGIAPLAGGNA